MNQVSACECALNGFSYALTHSRDVGMPQSPRIGATFVRSLRLMARDSLFKAFVAVDAFRGDRS